MDCINFKSCTNEIISRNDNFYSFSISKWFKCCCHSYNNSYYQQLSSWRKQKPTIIRSNYRLLLVTTYSDWSYNEGRAHVIHMIVLINRWFLLLNTELVESSQAPVVGETHFKQDTLEHSEQSEYLSVHFRFTFISITFFLCHYCLLHHCGFFSLLRGNGVLWTEQCLSPFQLMSFQSIIFLSFTYIYFMLIS